MTRVVVGAVVAVLIAWLAFVGLLWLLRPRDLSWAEAKRAVPDVVRLLRDLSRDPSVPRTARMRLWLLLGYLAVPFDLVPDFIPVLGYADDVIVVALVLRSVVRAAGSDALVRHWQGSERGLALVQRLSGLRR